jgi:PAS domain S-box-containing protein
VDYLTKPVNPETVKTRVKAHLEQKEEALRLSEIRYRRLFETAKDGILILDAGTGRILDVNPSLIGLLGLSQEAILGKNIWELASLKDIAADEDQLSELRLREYVYKKRVALGTADGRRIHVELVGNVYLVNHRSVIQFNMRDVTDQVVSERQRQELSERLHHYLATSPTITYSFRIEGGRTVWQWVSENVERILGYSLEEALEPDWWLGRVHPEDRKEVIHGLSELIRMDVLTRDYRFTTKDRRCIWLRDELRIMRSEDGNAEVVGTLTDVSAGKKAEAELALKGAALEAAANAMVITDRDGRLIWLNPAFERLSGYPREEAIGKNPGELVKSGMQDEGFYRAMWETILAGMVWNGTIVNRRKSGETYTEEMTITPILNKARRIVNFVAIKSDITERESTKLRLEAMNREKDSLLREVHHRVYNNMQLISSLLHLSSRNFDDGDDRCFLGGVVRRINSMALLHEQFYESEDMSSIEFSKSLRKIVDGIRADYPETAARIAVAYEAEEAFLNIEEAIPAGSREGRLRIRQRAVDPDMLEIEVRDDGIDLPRNFDPSKADSLGMILIKSLSKQLRGEVAFFRDNGTVATLRFPVLGAMRRPF